MNEYILGIYGERLPEKVLYTMQKYHVSVEIVEENYENALDKFE